MSDCCGQTRDPNQPIFHLLGRGGGCCAASGARPSLPSLEQPFVIGAVDTPLGPAPQVSARLTWADSWGSIKVRWGVGRMNYRVEPGLYALGRPDKDSPVLVTANYKMSFDRLRSALPGHSAWLLVLDTRGVNVWCAAGKGTFGTEELAARLKAGRLAELVAHRRVILPQLAGPGVAAHQVKRLSGFEVAFGPIEARDLPAFLTSGRAEPRMRLKSFTAWERAVLIPVELVHVLKWGLLLALALFFLGGLGGPEPYWAKAWQDGLFAVAGFAAAVLAGAVLTPLLLPWLPGRAFSFKGFVAGLALALLLCGWRWAGSTGWAAGLESAAWLILAPALAAFLAMNFTGASTFTSLSGVRKEMRLAVPLQILGGVVGLGLWFGSRFLA